MRKCTMNSSSKSPFFWLPQSLHFMLAKCKAKQDPQPWWNCTHTEGAAAANTFIHHQVCITRGLALGREPELGLHLSHNRPSIWHSKEKNLETRVQSWKLCGSLISPCVLPHALRLECSSLTLFVFPILQWSPRPLLLTAVCYYSSGRWQQHSI